MKTEGLARLLVVLAFIYSGAGVAQATREACRSKCLDQFEIGMEETNELRRRCIAEKCQHYIDPEPYPTNEQIADCRMKANEDGRHPGYYWKCTGLFKERCVTSCMQLASSFLNDPQAESEACLEACEKKFSEVGIPETQSPGQIPPTEPTGQSFKIMLRGDPLPWGTFGWGCSDYGGHWTQVCVEEPWGVYCFPPKFYCY